jgi:hypothetical protein
LPPSFLALPSWPPSSIRHWVGSDKMVLMLGWVHVGSRKR